MSQPYSAVADATGKAYVDIRVCDLLVQQGSMPKGLDSDFQIDGLYVVLRCQGDVRRTSCLWSSASGASPAALRGSATQRGAAAGACEAQSDDALVWNEMFRVVVPPALPLSTPATSPRGPHSPSSADGGDPQGGFSAPYTPPLHRSGSASGAGGGLRDMSGGIALPMSTAASGGMRATGSSGFPVSYAPQPSSLVISTPSLHSAAAQQQSSGDGNGARATEVGASHAPLFYPAIELELWRSAPLSENLLGRYTYHVPMELMQGGYALSNLDAVVERVVLLRTKEAPSIMGNLYGWSGHRLSLRLRVQAVGLAPLMAAWSPQQGSEATMTAASTIGSAAYPVPFPTGMLGNTVTGGPPYVAAGVYGAPLGTLNPVLVNLLAPLGVPTGGSGAGQLAPTMMMSMPGGMGGDNLHKPGQPPFFSMFPPASEAAANVGGRMFHPDVPGVLPATPQSSGQGILGDGDLTWQSGTTQPTVYPSYRLPR
ncbi:hypothetical protein, conserved [Leishmania donovani]|uniref:Uncharacterized protein n=1 Tax=Leishmania donovani TaxID=5661 RepID=E9BMJ5_LEIDO|nr:hypothetical protein, conserved [Leishmania donovani]TPP42706.1 hypothetical protein CGC21_11955 [Leishmania donovani]CBZ36473.1 hypothetical protein, conserved [Leishmania donovani]